ncbi:hypothetical protein AU381_22285 [Sinorhizobium glycinis]|uniref:Uncharacterized protein n=1 Tax=Sinorhizobium glycinis TaxID=1472378 RepID=A0A178XSQ6_9HYPH|nr:hypothetical protein [Sinorhizobium glycinis]OAP38308.1 hypothetical protein AU381_22285 [Sinorhizobium glycinis]
MSKVVVIGIPGEPGLWMADLGNGTVTPLNEVTGDLATVNGFRKLGSTFVNNIDLAIAVTSVEDVFAGHVDS